MVSLPPQVPPRLLYPVKDAAVLVGTSPRKVWRLIEEGRIRTKRLDGRRLIPRDVLEEFIARLPMDDSAA